MKKLKTHVLIIITAVILIVSAAFSLVIFKKSASTVEIYEDGALVGRYFLSEDRTVELAHNTIRIEDGHACMQCSDCKNQICVRTGKIDSSLYPIVCLPNRVMICVTGSGDVDAVAGD